MELTVESITGRRTKLNNVDPSETVRGLKTRLWKLDGVPVAQQSLVYRSQALVDERTLNDYQITNDAVIKLILITRSGPINKRVELYIHPKKPDVTVRSVNSSEPANLPCNSIAGEGRRQSPDGPAPSNNSSSTVRRYTRQQMRQAQVAAGQLIGKGAYSSHASGEPLSSDVEQQSSSSLLDLTFTPERQIASARRADENLRTMQRMRELRRSIERLNLEKSQAQRQRNSGSAANAPTIAESGPPRSRRPTGGSGAAAAQTSGAPAFSTGAQRSRSSTQLLASSADRHSAAAAAARAAYAADDTSAKESSAGETEMEDAGCYRQLTSSGSAMASGKQPALHAPSATKTRNQASAQQQLMPPPGFKSKQQLYRNIRRSSCSDVDVESSAVWSSDADVDAVSHNDRSREELVTADDLSLDDEDWGVVSGRQDDAQRAIVVDSSDDYEDATGDYERRPDDVAQAAPMIDGRNSSSAEDDAAATAVGLVMSGLLSRSGGQDISSDPSELSSGVVVCELSMALNNRRMKVKRKSYHTPRHANKRPQALGNGGATRGVGGDAVDETDDQSPLESPVKHGSVLDTARLFPSRFAHHNAASYRDHHHLHAGYLPGASGFFGGGAGARNWHRGRPRSKQRLTASAAGASTSEQQAMAMNLASSSGQQAAANNSTTTGDSSSDEREDAIRRDSQSNAAQTPTSSMPTASGRSANHGHKPPQSSQSQQRCNACACRLSVATTFQCRCGKTVCLRHRHADLHACTLLTAATVSEKK